MKLKDSKPRAKVPPDRVSAEQGPFFHRSLAPIRVTVDGVEYTGRVYEYCRTKGWAKVIDIDTRTGKAIMFAGFGGSRPRMHWVHGKVVSWFADQPVPDGAIDPTKVQDKHFIPQGQKAEAQADDKAAEIPPGCA